MPTTIQLDSSKAQSLATAFFEIQSKVGVVANLLQDIAAAATPGNEDNTSDTAAAAPGNEDNTSDTAAAAPGSEDNTGDTGLDINKSIIAPTINVDNNTTASMDRADAFTNTAMGDDDEEYHFNLTTDEGRVTFELLDNYAHVENGPKGLLDGKPVPACLYPCGLLQQNRENLPNHWHVQTTVGEAIYLRNSSAQLQLAFNGVSSEFTRLKKEDKNKSRRNMHSREKEIALTNFIVACKEHGIVFTVMKNATTVDRVATNEEIWEFAKSKASAFVQKLSKKNSNSDEVGDSNSDEVGVGKRAISDLSFSSPPTATPAQTKKAKKVTPATQDIKPITKWFPKKL